MYNKCKDRRRWIICNLINEVLTIKEASEIFDKEVSSLRRVLKGRKFIEGIDYRKSGNTWLVTKKSLVDVYGESIKGGIDMESKMIKIREKVLERVSNENIYECGEEITREEYYYCVGKSIAILQKHSAGKNDISKFLCTSSVKVLKDYKMALVKKHLEDFLNFTTRYSVDWNIVTVTFGYEPDSYTEEDKDILIFGYVDTI